MDTRSILDHFKLLTSIQSTVTRIQCLYTTAVHQAAVAALEGVAALYARQSMSVMILRIADAMANFHSWKLLCITVLQCGNDY